MDQRQELERAIRRHQALYDAGTPEISDSAFDALVAELADIAPNSPLLTSVSWQSTYGRKVKHRTPMLSLAKAYKAETLDAWCDTMESIAGTGVELYVMPKIDGVSCSMVFDGPDLVHAATRGDGHEGEDVTHLVRRLLPTKYADHLPHGAIWELRGEIAIQLSAWNSPLAARSGFANARNAAAGLIQRRSWSEQHELLSFCVFDVILHELPSRITSTPQALVGRALWPALSTLSARLTSMKRAGWLTASPGVIATRETVMDVIDELTFGPNQTGLGGACPFECDGLVVRLNYVDLWKEAGSTAHHPNGSIAWKFQGDTGTTKLVDVQWQVSRTGTVTPVIVVAPIKLSGVVVTRATLHNYREFRQLKYPYEGADVAITRRGGVIPHVEYVTADAATVASNKKFSAPSLCPSCGGPLSIDGAYLICDRRERCPDAVIGSLLHYIRVVGYDGVGPAMIASAYTEGVFDTLESLYTARPFHLLGLPDWGIPTAERFCDDLPRTLTPECFLQAIGIDGIGRASAERLMQHFTSIEHLLRWARDDGPFPQIRGIGDQTWLKLQETLASRYDELCSLLQHVTVEQKAPATGPLAGKSFVFTGRLTDMERGEAQEAVRALGATTPNGVTKDLSYLVVGALAKDEQATKRDKAHKYNARGSSIKIITEDAFLELLRSSVTL